MVKKKPDHVNTISAYLTVKGAADALSFYKKVFGAEEVDRHLGPDGKSIMHSQLKIGDSSLFISDEFADMHCLGPLAIGGSPVTLWFYVDDADAVYNKAIEAGAKVGMPMMDAFWGDRYGQFVCPWGHKFAISTHVEDVSPAEMQKRQEEFFKKQPAIANK